MDFDCYRYSDRLLSFSKLPNIGDVFVSDNIVLISFSRKNEIKVIWPPINCFRSFSSLAAPYSLALAAILLRAIILGQCGIPPHRLFLFPIMFLFLIMHLDSMSCLFV